MKKTRLISLILTFALIAALAAGCASAANDTATAEGSAAYDTASAVSKDASYTGETAVADSTAGGTSYTSVTAEEIEATSATASVERKLIENIYLEVTVDNPSEALKSLTAYAQGLGGYLLSSNDYYDAADNTGSSYVVVRVPAGNGDAIRAYLADSLSGDITNDSTDTQDVTDTYYDLETRIEQGEAEIDKLLELLDQCETVEEVLAVRSQLSSVQSDVESMKGQLKRLTELTSYDTITVSFSPQPNLVSNDDTGRFMSGSEFWTGLKAGFRKSVYAVVNGAGSFAIFLARVFLPLAAIGLFVWLVIGLFAKATKKRRAAKKARREAAREAAKGAPPYEKK